MKVILWRPAFRLLLSFVCLLAVFRTSTAQQADSKPSDETATDERLKWSRYDSGVRQFVELPSWRAGTLRTLVIYATPNGNTIEQTLGCLPAKDIDWHFDIQHVAAQVRCWRETDRDSDVVLAVVEAPRLSWPAFCRDQADSKTIIRTLVDSLIKEYSADRVVLCAHSGGGAFVFAYLDAVESLPASIWRIVFLDANYGYSDDRHHGDKLLAWMKGEATRRLIVTAYDDREIALNGKKVVGPDGGTYRATQRMTARLRRDVELLERDLGPFHHTNGLAGQAQFFVHSNPENKILHTALVGEMNGLLHGLSLGTKHEDAWGRFGGPRAYSKWIPTIPIVEPKRLRATLVTEASDVRLKFAERPNDAPTGSQILKQIENLSRTDREAAVLKQFLDGNIPNHLRSMKAIRVGFTDDNKTRHECVYFVMPDYLAIGRENDFFRMPITPQTAMAVADAVSGMMITRKISDDLLDAAEVRLEPKPLTKDRDAVSSFWQHQQIIEEQLAGKARAALVAGMKKDLVLTNRLREKPHKVAIYGWHHPDGRPIQPLYVGHIDWYVDYSHGVRLMADRMLVDGKSWKVADVLKDAQLHKLLSDEGPMDVIELRRSAGWQH